MIEIFTDGACSGNPGPGGFGIIMKSGEYRKELFQGFQLTTNNRMELMGVCVALESLRKPDQKVLVYTDSKYVVDAVEKGWLNSWLKKMDFAGKKNKDLWLRYIEIADKHKVSFKWVKGHNGHSENEICDQLAVRACKSDNLLIDLGYEKIL